MRDVQFFRQLISLLAEGYERTKATKQSAFRCSFLFRLAFFAVKQKPYRLGDRGDNRRSRNNERVQTKDIANLQNPNYSQLITFLK